MAVGAAISNKSEVVKALNMLNTLATRWLKQIGWDIGEKENSEIQTVEAKEFLQGKFSSTCMTLGSEHDQSSTYDHEQMTNVDRSHRTLTARIRTLRCITPVET